MFGVEPLEDRRLLTSLPHGAHPHDTAEYMLGDVVATVVLLESTFPPEQSHLNLEDWTAGGVQQIVDRVEEGLAWWEDALYANWPSAPPNLLSFSLDLTYATVDTAVPTAHEPITETWNNYSLWVNDFLTHAGFNTDADLFDDMWAFNHAQREAHQTDWAFTIFVANSQNDVDDNFPPGQIRGAFTFRGGLFTVMPSQRHPNIIAHETSHIFYAKDEYEGGASYNDRRGYYDTQNLNAIDDRPADAPPRVDSILAEGTELARAYDNYQISPSGMEMMGWKDSDGDGIFDVLDVEHTLEGSGAYDPVSGNYRFLGSSSVRTLPNLNPEGLGNDITLNRIHRAEYRVDGGPWQTAATYDATSVELDLTISGVGNANQIEIRTVDDVTGVTSATFVGNIDLPNALVQPGINGYVWVDVDEDGVRELGEPGLSGWTVRALDSQGQPLDSPSIGEPDDYPNETVDPTIAGAQLSIELPGVFGVQPGVRQSSKASTDSQVFAYYVNDEWYQDFDGALGQKLRIDFDSAVGSVSLDAIGAADTSYGRLEAYDAQDDLLDRFTTHALAAGQSKTMSIRRHERDIKYVVAYGGALTKIQLDNLQFGAQPTVVTDALGAYAIPYLDAGVYRVEALSKVGWTATIATVDPVNLGSGQVVTGIDFGHLPDSAPYFWQNPADPLDVDDSGDVTIDDARALANSLQLFGPRELPSPSVPPNSAPPYLDVNGDAWGSLDDLHALMQQLYTRVDTLDSQATRSGQETLVQTRPVVIDSPIGEPPIREEPPLGADSSGTHLVPEASEPIRTAALFAPPLEESYGLQTTSPSRDKREPRATGPERTGRETLSVPPARWSQGESEDDFRIPNPPGDDDSHPFEAAAASLLDDLLDDLAGDVATVRTQAGSG